MNKSNAVNPLDYLGKGGIGGTPQPEGLGSQNQYTGKDMALTITMDHTVTILGTLQQQEKYYIGMRTGEKIMMYG